jgi:hypothetical protein
MLFEHSSAVGWCSRTNELLEERGEVFEVNGTAYFPVHRSPSL